MMTLLLYGHLGRRFGRVHRRAVRTAAEAVRALAATLPGFRRALIDGGAYRVLSGGREALPREALADPLPSGRTLRLVPVVAGAGRGFGKIVIGAALIAAAFYTGGASLSMSAAWAAGGTTLAGYFAGQIGVSLVLSGLSQSLSKTPENRQAPDAPNNLPSYAFDGAVNTAAQGNPVPVCYGRLMVGSQVVSAGLVVEQIAASGGGTPAGKGLVVS